MDFISEASNQFCKEGDRTTSLQEWRIQSARQWWWCLFFLRDIFLNTGQCFFFKCVHFLCGSLKNYGNMQNVSLILVTHCEEKASHKRSIRIMEIGSLCPVNNSWRLLASDCGRRKRRKKKHESPHLTHNTVLMQCHLPKMFFVALIKCGVHALVGEIRHYRNDRYYYY